MIKRIILCSVLALVGCGQDNKKQEKMTVKLAHNHSSGFPVDIAYNMFADIVKEKSEGRFTIEVYPDAQLGNSIQALELAQVGVVQFAHINSAALESFDEIYSIFNLPYVFKDYKHFRTVMGSETVKQVFESTLSQGFMPLITLEGGARSFYTKNKAITSPADLKGVKIRVQESPTSIEMVKLLGGTPVVLSFGEVYTSLQQGVIDGAENNAPSFVQTGHAEVAKYFSLNEHLRLADFLAVSANFWNDLSVEDKEMFKAAAKETEDKFATVWAESEAKSFEEAKTKYNVTITEVDQEPFRQLVLPLQEQVAQKDVRFKDLLEYIRSVEN